MFKKIYKQTYKNFEIIIIDNNSDDKTIKKANEFKLKIININKFLPGKAINVGLKESKRRLYCLYLCSLYSKKIIIGLKI